MSINVNNLSYIYNNGTPFAKKALDSVSLQIDDGDFFGIIGHTGSGKSTLIQHFNALVIPTEGTVKVDGIDIADKKADLKLLRSKVGMVFQYPEYQLFAETVFEDVAFGIRNFYKRKNKNKKDAPVLNESELENMVREAVTLVGLDYEKVKDKSPFDLSGGQKRRVAIAGVIATKPKILVLDEPTAGLDPRGKTEILKLIHSLKENCSLTIVMISHDMDEIARNCTRIAVIREGHIVCVKTPVELFSDEKLVNELGIDVPEPVKIIRMLKEKGLVLNRMVFTAEELSQEIAEALKKRGLKEGGNA